MRVLLADSNERSLAIVQAFLWDSGHEAEVVTSGIECMTFLRKFHPDVLVLDRGLMWGGSDGVLARLQEEHDLGRIPVVLLTDKISQCSASVWSSSCMVLQRPLHLRKLLALILAAHGARTQLESYRLN